MSQERRRRIVSIALTIALTAAFCLGFLFLKHDHRVQKSIPFGDDPYDSVGSFAFLASAPLSLILLGRLFWPKRAGSGAEAKLLLVRTQIALLLAIAFTGIADVVALAIHFETWVHAPGAPLILTVVGGELAAAGVMIGLLCRDLAGQGPRLDRRLLTALASLLAFVAALSLFPPGAIKSIPGELLAIAFGFVWLFWQLNIWLPALAPGQAADQGYGARSPPAIVAMAGAVAIGAIVGAGLFALEALGEGGVAPKRALLLAAIFIGAGGAGFGTGYAFLRRPLRLL